MSGYTSLLKQYVQQGDIQKKKKVMSRMYFQGKHSLLFMNYIHFEAVDA